MPPCFGAGWNTRLLWLEWRGRAGRGRGRAGLWAEGGPEPALNWAPSGTGELVEGERRTTELDQVEAEGGGDVGRLRVILEATLT